MGFEESYGLFMLDNKIFCVDHNCVLKSTDPRSPPFSIDADSKKMAAYALDGDLVIYNYTKHLRKKYLKHL